MLQNQENLELIQNPVRSVEDSGHTSRNMVLMFADNVLEKMQKNQDSGNTINMAMNDTLAAALSNILNAEKVGKATCVVTPVSKITKAVLDIMKEKFARD